MGVHVARGTEPWRIFAQYMGRADGLAAGKDGNVHMADIRLGLIAMVSHLPALMPVAVGCALAFQIRREPRVAVGWSGDGAMARGDAHEAMNLAGVRRLPVVFIVDNNQYAYSTPNRLEFACEHLADRAAAYGFEGVVVDGCDVLTVYREAHAAIEKARAGGGPTLLELVTLRMKARGPRRRLLRAPREARGMDAQGSDRALPPLAEGGGRAVGAGDDEIGVEVKKLLNEAMKRADESPLPAPPRSPTASTPSRTSSTPPTTAR